MEIRYLGQDIEDFFRDPITEIGLLRVRGHIDEGQHGDGGIAGLRFLLNNVFGNLCRPTAAIKQEPNAQDQQAYNDEIIDRKRSSDRSRDGG